MDEYEKLRDLPKEELLGEVAALHKRIEELEKNQIERKRAEESLQKKLASQLFQAEKMEAVGTLAGGMAHDFNNILMAIQGHVSVMLTMMDPRDSNYQKLKIIEQRVKKGAELTNQLIGFARGGKYEITQFNLNQLIQRTVSIYERRRKEISIHERYSDELWPVDADKNQIEQVLMHLYGNAWQAMPKGGGLYIETSNVLLDENYNKPFNIKPGPYVKVSVTDTGTGMDEKTRQRIFEPFFTTREMGRGTGLGLAFAYGVIKNHGGLINVYSEVGHGTTFNIYLPASKEKIVQGETAEADMIRGNETILVVDDEEMIIDVSKEILEILGYRVIIARSGNEACEIYRDRKDGIDLVILDMIMPGMGGSETYDCLKTINPHLRVLLASGYTMTAEAAAIMKNGRSGFIQKPFTINDLSRKVRELLDR